jgi:hypothetical protein
MLASIRGVMCSNEGCIMQQHKDDKVRYKPCALLVLQNHLLQLVQQLTSELGLNMVDQDKVQLRTEDWWNRNLAAVGARAI